jgi:tetratricopeptide (TPR) repeat protein
MNRILARPPSNPVRWAVGLVLGVTLALVVMAGVDAASAAGGTAGERASRGGAKRSADRLFEEGRTLYARGDYSRAAAAFRASAAAHPASGALHNLGNSEWMAGRTGRAVLAWEQALWVSPRNEDARRSLRFARAKADLLEPKLAWFELPSVWLPFDCWPWIAGASLWLSLSLLVLPAVLRSRRADWHHALSTAALAVFLLSLPALLGVRSRSHLGFILRNDAAVRLTPTRDGEVVTLLPAGEAAREEQQRGDYVFVRSSNAAGWVRRGDFGVISRDQAVASAPGG